MRYVSEYSVEFEKQVKKYSSFKNLIKKKIESLLEDPYHNCKSEPLHHPLKGFRSARLTKNIRILFAICKEAKQFVPLEIQQQCNRLGGEGIVFVSIRVHEKAYKP